MKNRIYFILSIVFLVIAFVFAFRAGLEGWGTFVSMFVSTMFDNLWSRDLKKNIKLF